MSTTPVLPNQAPRPVEPTRAYGSGETSENALIPSPHPPEAEMLIPPNTLAARLPVEVDVTVPLRDFRVRNLLTLEPGILVESQWAHGEDVPLGCGDVQLAWSEFEVVDTQLAVRLTRLV